MGSGRLVSNRCRMKRYPASGGRPLEAGVVFQAFEAFARDDLDDIAKGADRLGQSVQIVIADRIARRIAGLDIGAFEQLEPATVDPGGTRPSLDQPGLAILGERAQKFDVV